MPPIDAAAVARERADILTAAAAGQKVNVPAPTLSRWRKLYRTDGLAGLEPKYTFTKEDGTRGGSGRKPLAKLDEVEEITAKQLYVKTGSMTLALRTLAGMDVCSQATADVILKVRASKHNIPRTLRDQVDLPQVVMAHHKSQKQARTHFFINPRELTYLDPSGQEQPLRVGDLSERDDMSNNFLVWVDWPQGGDPCSDKYGVRIARGQLLCQIDVRSLYFQSFCFLIRLRDSYRADDIWNWVGQTYRNQFVPAIGERWERGIWSSHKLRGHPIEPGHTPDEMRIGGLQALGRRVIESHSPTTKIIENRFKFFQAVCRTIPGQIGASRGEMERETKLWMECAQGRRDPRTHFLSYEQATEQLEAKMQFCNHEPMEGTLYRGVPAELYSTGLAERDDLKPLAPEQAYLFSRDLRWATCNKAHAQVRYTLREGGRRAWWFHHEQLYKYEGRKLAVYMDEECPEQGAVVVPIVPGKKPEPLACELVDGMPQFALGLDLECGPGAQAMIDASLRRDRQNHAVRSEYRAIGLAGRRLAKSSALRDGAGRSIEISSGGSPTGVPAGPTHSEELASHDAARRGGSTRTKAIREASGPTRGTAPLSDNADYMSRLEAQFLEANPGVEVT